MPGGGFSGDGSVKWFVKADYARPGTNSVVSNGHSVGHDGIEETPGGGYEFVVTIKHPQRVEERKEFLKLLKKAAADTKAGKTVLRLPVEDKLDGYKPLKPGTYQVTVDWRPTKKTKKGNGATTTATYAPIPPINYQF